MAPKQTKDPLMLNLGSWKPALPIHRLRNCCSEQGRPDLTLMRFLFCGHVLNILGYTVKPLITSTISHQDIISTAVSLITCDIPHLGWSWLLVWCVLGHQWCTYQKHTNMRLLYKTKSMFWFYQQWLFKYIFRICMKPFWMTLYSCIIILKRATNLLWHIGYTFVYKYLFSNKIIWNV